MGHATMLDPFMLERRNIVCVYISCECVCVAQEMKAKIKTRAELKSVDIATFDIHII